jgi:integrase
VRFEKWIRGSALGRTPLYRITATQLREFLESVDNGPGARANVYQLLAKVLNQAVNDGILTRSPLKSVRAPKKERKREVEPLSVPIIERLADHTRDEMYRLSIHLAAYAGLRAGEIGGLRLQDVDQLTCQLSVVQATSREGGKAVLGPVKTKGSRRRIEVPRFLIDELMAFIAAHGVMDDGRIFRTRKGGYLEHIRLNQECQAAATRAGLPPINFHSLRHTCVSLLIQSGAQPKRIQVYVGHANIGMTMDTYGHLFASDSGEIAARMEALRLDAMPAVESANDSLRAVGTG